MDKKDRVYELKKDVSMPGHYYRAGMQKTGKEWQKEFEFINIEWESEWFIDLTPPEKPEVDPLREIIEDVFSTKKLRSITYKEAAREVAEKFVTYLRSEKQLS